MRFLIRFLLFLLPISAWAQTVPTPQCVTLVGSVLSVVPCAANPTFVSVTTTGVAGQAGGHIYTAGKAPTVAAGTSAIYADSSTRRLMQNPNGSGATPIVGLSAPIPANHVPMMAPNGVDLVDSGMVITPAFIAALQKWLASLPVTP